MIKAQYKHNEPHNLKLILGLLIVLAFLGGLGIFTIRELPGRIGTLQKIAVRGSEFVQTITDKQDSPNAKLLETVRVGTATGPLKVSSENPRYFTDGSGKAIYLTGSHVWLNFQDGVLTDPPPAFDYSAYLDFLETQNHNFFRLWMWEQTKWVTERTEPYYFTPHPWQRTGPGNALDEKPKFDLTKFNQSFFDRLRERVIEAGNRGIYVSIMLFDGWSVGIKEPWFDQNNPWKGHPFNANNNINGINGDLNGDNYGFETHELDNPEVTAIQEAYVKKIIDTVNDLDNVLYEISNESHEGSLAWQYHMIDFIHSYEQTKPKQHPVGMTHLRNDEGLLNSEAEWISIGNDGQILPPVADGSKVSILDTDHLCGICGDRAWVWEAFTRGHNPIFMDQYDDGYKWLGGGYDMNNPNDVSLRENMGYSLTYANRMNLIDMLPRPDLCSTGYCLANPVASGAEYLIYLPAGSTVKALLEKVGNDKNPDLYLPTDSHVTVDLSATPDDLTVEWFNPDRGTTTDGGTVVGGSVTNFTAPFSGDAVLYIYSTSLPQPTPTPKPGDIRQFYLPWICH